MLKYWKHVTTMKKVGAITLIIHVLLAIIIKRLPNNIYFFFSVSYFLTFCLYLAKSFS